MSFRNIPRTNVGDLYGRLEWQTEQAIDALYVAMSADLSADSLSALSSAINERTFGLGLCIAGMIDFGIAYRSIKPRIPIPYSRRDLPSLSIGAQHALSRRIAQDPAQSILNTNAFFSTNRDVHNTINRRVYRQIIPDVPSTPGVLATCVALEIVAIDNDGLPRSSSHA